MTLHIFLKKGICLQNDNFRLLTGQYLLQQPHRLINGLIPHFYEGELEGFAMVNGLNVTEAELYETAKLVGSVFQNPRSQFFCVDTTSELAFGCENMGMPENEVHACVDAAAK